MCVWGVQVGHKKLVFTRGLGPEALGYMPACCQCHYLKMQVPSILESLLPLSRHELLISGSMTTNYRTSYHLECPFA